jgi:glycosyltransferase involved in cell wall biosynthesis
MNLAVAICTWNRAARLRGALASLANLDVPREVDWSVLVVDNGSRDQTAEVAASFSRRLSIRHVVETHPGLSRARNRALREALEAGRDYVLWIDDDVLVEPGWLSAYANAFQRWPEEAVFGGPVRPVLEGTPPEWLVRCLPRVAYTFAALDLGDEPVALGAAGSPLPYGCNFALRLQSVGTRRFREDLGRRHGGRLRGGEESELIAGLLAESRRGRWVPGARVTHQVGAERQTTSYLRSYSVNDAIDDDLTRAGAVRRSRVALLARWLAAEGRYRTSRLIHPPEVWVANLIAAGDAWGRLRAGASQRAHR